MGSNNPQCDGFSSVMGRTLSALVVLFVSVISVVAAQTPSMPSTQRYGSGLLDIPVSNVLPHLNVATTYSGFWSSLGRRIEIDDSGHPSGFGPSSREFFKDFSASVGIFDWAEAGVTVQSLNDASR